ncbi:asparagine synthetase domain containing protein 1 [Cordyceps fumosorosea ARSEF 2679]|uniref:Asparagine synthetase domain containing protein 1 n=1 Tax=Cordyceps fumosorosea (strain ARSEF 2679) TaxID=1081104 RepID=A0A168CP30_CORFA|nr:asparagine synthetase domain containing protein 1 [Cordyceps fumosorosea ARSEF 2679]OAA71615.1 asparagine synthetase domain containing protein 1 [Cordyceps fumosorosea ARSEF 2679]
MEQTTIAFDLYGTLLSTDSIATELASLYGDEKAKTLAARARTLQLEYTWRSNSMNQYQSFSDVTRWSFRHATAELGLQLSPADEERVMNAYNGLDTFPDANAALEILAGEESVNAYVFSNGDPSMLASSMATAPALSSASRVLPPTRVISVEPLRVFKPHPSVYENLVEVAGKKGNPGSVWLVSSNPFDVCGAAASGLKSAWVDRAGKGWLDGLANGTGNNPTMVARTGIMCGIHAAISRNATVQISDTLESRLRSRGPDHLGSQTVHFPDARLCVALTSTVLALRGDHTTAQPLVNQGTGSALCWNGEAWRIHGEPVTGNDGETVLSKLAAASVGGEAAILDTLRAIEGPFAFAFVDKPNRTLYYGRDRLGRRSLLVNPGSPFQLSSVSDTSTTGWLEVEADGCYSISLTTDSLTSAVGPSRHDWDSNEKLISAIGEFNSTVPDAQKELSEGYEAVSMLKSHLLQSLQYRVQGVPVPPGADGSQARIAVLFSGGLDCTVLARLTDDLLPEGQEIDLLNVAFENPRIAAQRKNLDLEKLYELCPDRVTGRQSFAELIQSRPKRKWRFVAVNVPYADTTSHRDTVVGLISPHNTEMDLSIAFALYFAARGQGLAQTGIDAEPYPYATTARVLLSGLGADELFGGYSRHGIAFQRLGYEGLIAELKLDVGRLGKRNLGRDDRAMSHWGREVRLPFLDESLVKWAIEMPVWQKCDFGKNPDGEGDVEPAKRILRLLARDLGLRAVAFEKKRAIQFGARTAKMESGRTKGTTLIGA